MDERRDSRPDSESRPLIAAAASELAPPQKAWSAYVQHATRCHTCRSRDGRCSESEQLYKAWQAKADDAYRQVADGQSARPAR
ncbi:hypothetical protein [Streptomyces bullii]|uniref:Uncharacterized protein n=1 Tax=Streptomyces bullii TaxID=349910 RepID=A0ABW0UQF4_9ACTN